MQEITVQELKARRDQGDDNFVLIDVREPHEHQEYNIGGTLIPVGSIMQRIEELEDHKEDEIIVYCRSGARSGMIQGLLQGAGFKNVLNLRGGMLAWQDMVKQG
jgi:rhodanese-related sulfurtransferase